MSNDCVETDKVVSVTYRIIAEDGSVLEQVDVPVSYVHGGDGRLFKKIEDALEGCEVGDYVDVMFTPAEGFGEYDPDLTFTDDIENVPEQFRQVGAEVEMENEDGEMRTFTVSSVDDDKLTVDCNHPLAGKTVTFTVEVIAIRDATEKEIEIGTPDNPVLH